MKALPGPLAPWAQELAALSSDAQSLLGSWMPTLDRLLGPHTQDRHDDDGVPDGLNGLGRRGRYERLALSEWGLLDVAPEEFLRRAGSGEHLFHQIARSGGTGDRRLVVLFDAGPMQLGTPRLAHLAWLLVLARRAARGGAHLVWGMAHAPDLGLREGADPPALRSLLARRSGHLAGADQRARWATELGPPANGEERWLVSAAPDRRWEEALGAGTLVVAEPDEPGEPVLRVEATHAGHKSRAVLRLPATEICARIVRDPLAVERAVMPGGRLAAGGQFTFSAGGTHLLVRMSDDEIVAMAVPAKGRQVGSLARFTPGKDEAVVAAGWRKGKMYVATVHERGVRLHIARGRRWQVREREVKGDAILPRPAKVLLPGLAADSETGAFWFGDADWRVYHGFVSGGYVFSVPETVLGWAWAQGRMNTVGRVGSGPLELFVHRHNGLDRTELATQAASAIDAHISLNPAGRVRFVVVSVGDQKWHLHTFEPRTVALTLPHPTPIYGALLWQGQACCLVRSADGQCLQILGEGQFHATFPLGPIEHACVQPGGNLIAAQVAGELRVIDLDGKERLRWGGQGT